MLSFACDFRLNRVELELTKGTAFSHPTLKYHIRIRLEEHHFIEECFIVVSEGGLAELSRVTNWQFSHMPFTEQPATSPAGGQMQRLGHMLSSNATRRHVKLGRLGSAETGRSRLKHAAHDMRRPTRQTMSSQGEEHGFPDS